MDEVMRMGDRGMELISRDPAAIAAAEAAKIARQSQYIMAINRPRNLDQVRAVMLKNAERLAFAEMAEYSKPVGNRQISGPSIRLAEMAIRAFGNIATETAYIYEDDTIRRIRMTATELESNSTFIKEIQISKTVERRNPPKDREIIGKRTNTLGETVYIVRATEDELLNKENALISKCIRNEALRLIPGDLIEETLEACRATLRRQDARDPEAAKKTIIDAFTKFGIMPTDLEKLLGHPIGQCQANEIRKLREIYAAIKDGEAKFSDYLPQTAATPEPAAAAANPLFAKPKQTESQPPQAPATAATTPGTPKPDAAPKKTLDELIAETGAPVKAADIENYLRADGKLTANMALNKNAMLYKSVTANIKKIANATAEWLETQKNGI